jgi:hypothetical protein
MLGYHPGDIERGHNEAGDPVVIRGVKTTARQTELRFRFSMLEEVGKFLRQIGFADDFKQDKVSTAYDLIKRYGSSLACKHWLEKYTKKDGFEFQTVI